MTTIDALNYVIDRLCREANIRPGEQNQEVLQRKLAAILTLAELRDSLSSTGVST